MVTPIINALVYLYKGIKHLIPLFAGDRAELDLEQERMRVEKERRKNQELRDRLLKMGIDPDRLS